MTARIVRPRSDSARLPFTLGGIAAGALAGYFLGAAVFRTTPEGAPGPEPEPPVEPAPTAPPTPPTPRPATVDAGPPATVSVRLSPGVLTACGDGEELNIAAPQCNAPPSLATVLGERLAAVLPRCPSAPLAARNPNAVLALGLRVDMPRRRVGVLLGRRTTVPEKVSYVACVSDGLRDLDALWRTQTAHPRYLLEFSARFSPLGTMAPEPAAPPEPEPAAPAPAPAPEPAAPATPEPAAPAPAPEPAAPAAPSAGLPTAAELGRMRATGRATVTWSAAVVRDAPRTGAIVGRIPQGTEVELLDRRGGWFAIRWGRSNNVGWTFREAIGQ